jgi:hypothetical protein
MQTYKDIVRRKLGSFRHYPIDLEICKCVFIMVVDKKNKKIPNMVVLTQYILGIPTIHSETIEYFLLLEFP